MNKLPVESPRRAATHYSFFQNRAGGGTRVEQTLPRDYLTVTHLAYRALSAVCTTVTFFRIAHGMI